LPWLARQPRPRRERKIDATDAERPRARDGFEIVEHLRQAGAAERTVKEEDRADDHEGRDRGGVAFEAADARQSEAGREALGGANELGLNLDADRSGAGEQVHERDRPPRPGPDVDEHVGCSDGRHLDHPQQDLDRAREIGDAPCRERRTVAGQVVEAQHPIDPGVPVARGHAQQGRAKRRRIVQPARDR